MTTASQKPPIPSGSCLTSAAEGYERWAPIYDRSPNPLLAREERYLLPLLGDVRNRDILDLACGTGRWLEKLAAHGCASCVGIDCSAAMLGVANAKPIAGWLARATCESLPFANEVFDLAICSFALGHIVCLERFVAEVFRVSRPGADLFVADLHPAAYKSGWRVAFRNERTAVEIETIDRDSNTIIAAFLGEGFHCISHQSLWLETPERSIFARAGKDERFEAASQIPAIIAFHFQRAQPSDRGMKR